MTTTSRLVLNCGHRIDCTYGAELRQRQIVCLQCLQLYSQPTANLQLVLLISTRQLTFIELQDFRPHQQVHIEEDDAQCHSTCQTHHIPQSKLCSQCTRKSSCRPMSEQGQTCLVQPLGMGNGRVSDRLYFVGNVGQIDIYDITCCCPAKNAPVCDSPA